MNNEESSKKLENNQIEEKVKITDNNEMEESDKIVENSKKMGKFEKIFWITIAFFVFAYLILYFFAYKNTQHINKQTSQDEKPILKQHIKTIIEIVDDNETIKNNLENNEAISSIQQNLELKKENMNLIIENRINQAFLPVYNNIDSFLDYHYSVIGEYSELGAAATGEIGESIKNRLFGEQFDTNLEQAQSQINNAYVEKLKEHIKHINDQALNDVNLSLNSDVLLKLNQDIEKRFTAQEVKVGLVLGSATAIKIISIIGGKIATKTVTKIAAKSTLKMTTKTTATSSAAAAGTLCGPLAWICSPVAATVAWFGTDAALISVDEYMNRDEFKKEITTMIDEQKNELTDKMKSLYSKQFSADSILVQNTFKNTTIKKEVKKTIIEKIGY
jgi:hypothetical protein